MVNMKKIVVIIFLIINCWSCKQIKKVDDNISVNNRKEQPKQEILAVQPKQNDVKIEKTLITFYKNYMIAQDNENKNQVESLKKKYLTKELLNKINNGFYDYDPILNAQDVSADNSETIKVFKEGDLYKVCYTWVLRGEISCTKLKIIKSKNNFKISEFID